MDQIKNLKAYALFLLQEKYLTEAVMRNINSLRKQHSSIIDHLGPLTEEEVILLITKSFSRFLNDVAGNRGLDNILESFNSWKKSNYDLKDATITATDIMMAYEVRKDVMIKMIPYYTEDYFHNIQLREELDALFFIARKHGMLYTKEQNTVNR